MATHRPYTHWDLRPPCDPAAPSLTYAESASFGLVLEQIRKHAEIVEIGRSHFVGSLSQRNALWREYRNFLRQALSNFAAALKVEDRSANLLLYYAMLNFAKADLMPSESAAIVNKRVGHGLSFNPTNAKSVVGDHLTVQDGIFPLLYRHRTGAALPVGTRIPIRRLLGAIPEIGEQVGATGLAAPQTGGLLQMLCADATRTWTLLAFTPMPELDGSNVTAKLIRLHFEEVDQPEEWRDHFALSRRWSRNLRYFQSRVTVPAPAPGSLALGPTIALTWQIKDVLGMRTTDHFDAIVSPSLYKSRMVPMPPSLARYAVLFYASSLVRYKPSMFDAQSYPEQAYLFDAIARECALPAAVDALRGLLGQDVLFEASDTMRL